jgi:hypothetical protein
MQLALLTSNAYVHCLAPFAHLFNLFWSDQQPVTVFGYDVKPSTPLPRNFRWVSLGDQQDYTFSAGVLAMLDKIPGEVFGLFLEDYFIDRPVRQDVIYRAADLMAADASISKIDLTNDRLKVGHTPIMSPLPGVMMIESADDAGFQMSLQAAIWRKDMLARFVDPKENPWQFEKLGSRRVVAARKKGTFTGRVLGMSTPPVTYINAVGGEGSQPGVWAYKRFPEWMLVMLRGKGLING